MSLEAERLAATTEFPDLQAGALLSRARVLTLAGRGEEARPYVTRAVDVYEGKGNVLAVRLVDQGFRLPRINERRREA